MPVIIEDHFAKEVLVNPGFDQPEGIAAFADGHIQGYAVTPETAADMMTASRVMTNLMEQLITFGAGSVDLIKSAAAEINAAQKALG